MVGSPSNKIPKVLGKGSYGCVHSPALTCDPRQPKQKNIVSKVMNTWDAKNELNEFVLIGNADKNENFYLGKPTKCELKKNNLNKQAMINCHDKYKFNSDRMEEYSLLLLKHGGEDLYKYGERVQKMSKTPENVKELELFWIEVSRILYGLKIFQENDIIHLDLKPQNIVYNVETNRINFIDFGFLTTKPNQIAKIKRGFYRTGYTHWSYPFETTLYDEAVYDKLRKNPATANKNQYYIDNLTNINDNCDSFFQHVLPQQSKEVKKLFYLNYNETILESQNVSFNDFIKKSVDTFDLYGVGIAMLYMIKSSRHLLDTKFTDDVIELFLNCVTAQVYDRYTVDTTLSVYHNIIGNFMNKHNKHFVNNFAVDDNSKYVKAKKSLNKTIKKIKLSSPTTTDITTISSKPCPDNKEYNRRTKRCVKKCKPNQVRNEKFNCVNAPKECVETQEKNPKSGRCVNKCKPGYSRNSSFRCVKDKIVKPKICPNGKVLNLRTNKCEKIVDCSKCNNLRQKQINETNAGYNNNIINILESV